MSERPLRDGLRELYGRLDADIAKVAVKCDVCGRCCRFAEFDHVLYLSNVEAFYLCEDGVPAGSGSDACPFLDGARCTAHERRALGCRTFSCDKRHREALQSLYETYHRAIQRLAEGAGIAWKYYSLADQLTAAREGALITSSG
jgi:Fe-S-cluster containining protein